MSPKRKSKSNSSISVTGGVKGVGNVVGNDSQSNVSISSTPEQSPSTRSGYKGRNVLWTRLAAFLLALFGILIAVGLFIRILEEFNPLLVAQLVLAGLVAALGISGFLKPSLFVDLFGKLFGKE